MARTITVEGGPILLDELLAKVFGPVAARGLLVATMELNPGLAAEGPILPIGRTITLPDVAPAAAPSKRVIGIFE